MKKTKTTAKKKKLDKKQAKGKVKAVKKAGVKTKKINRKKEVVKIEKKKGEITLVKKAKVKKAAKTRSSKNKMNDVWVEVLMKDPRVRKWLVQAIGEHSIHVIQQIVKELSDEDIAKKAELRASDVRVVLNRLHAHGLATYSRSRDKNSGWYSYNWKLDEKAAMHLAQGITNEVQEVETAKDEGGERYYCEADGQKLIYSFEQAVEVNFKCPKTGQKLKYLE